MERRRIRASLRLWPRRVIVFQTLSESRRQLRVQLGYRRSEHALLLPSDQRHTASSIEGRDGVVIPAQHAQGMTTL
jgi:hypothetical protein